ncbi:CDK5RAP1-like protein [Culicoides brevitarsis]|uniref:CDK5RAP1-like protein n=1 Tax=Culicoides brevitarsis TaxID=469753 RepID=UPI00307B80EF
MLRRILNKAVRYEKFTRNYSDTQTKIRNIKDGPNLQEFLVAGRNLPKVGTEDDSYLSSLDFYGNNRKVFIETYGCQMNVSDTEIVWSILKKNGYDKTENIQEADAALLMTCAIREGAEIKIWNRLKHISAMKANRSKRRPRLQVGILGCMAERLKTKVLEEEKSVDIVCGPDAYKDLPRLLALTRDGKNAAVNVLLSLDETYADVTPVRLDENSVSAFVSIMRGCDNMCSYCIVPFTRGRERSRPIPSIEEEVRKLAEEGIKEITLLGQNVNSYRDTQTKPSQNASQIAKGFRTVYKNKEGGARFGELLARIAEAVPEVRIRFTSPHPKDFPDEFLTTINNYPNICKSLHLPAQSGSTTVLERMRRGYTREAYLELIDHVRSIIPNVSLSSDFICGFCGETDEEFEDTISLMEKVKYNVAFLFPYSMREKTTAHRRMQDDVPEEVKKQRVIRMVDTFRAGALEQNQKLIGGTELILIEGASKRSEKEFQGRTDGNIKVIIPSLELNDTKSSQKRKFKPGDYVSVKITDANSQVLKGTPIEITSIKEFYRNEKISQVASV